MSPVSFPSGKIAVKFIYQTFLQQKNWVMKIVNQMSDVASCKFWFKFCSWLYMRTLLNVILKTKIKF